MPIWMNALVDKLQAISSFLLPQFACFAFKVHSPLPELCFILQVPLTLLVPDGPSSGKAPGQVILTLSCLVRKSGFSLFLGTRPGWSPDPHTDTDFSLALLSLFLGLLSTSTLGYKDRGWFPNLYPQQLSSGPLSMSWRDRPSVWSPFSHCHMRSRLIFSELAQSPRLTSRHHAQRSGLPIMLSLPILSHPMPRLYFQALLSWSPF